jgi:hypothetical protein
MELFLSDGLNNCAASNYPPTTFLTYPAGRYPGGLADFRDNHTDKKRFSTYFWEGIEHQNLFAPGGNDRFYQKIGGLDMTIAEWLTRLLQGEAVHRGLP